MSGRFSCHCTSSVLHKSPPQPRPQEACTYLPTKPCTPRTHGAGEQDRSMFQPLPSLRCMLLSTASIRLPTYLSVFCIFLLYLSQASGALSCFREELALVSARALGARCVLLNSLFSDCCHPVYTNCTRIHGMLVSEHTHWVHGACFPILPFLLFLSFFLPRASTYLPVLVWFCSQALLNGYMHASHD